MKNIVSVIGQGFVGGSLAHVLSERGFDVYVHDKVGKRAQQPAITSFDSIEQLVAHNRINVERSSRVYFVCVPTPMQPDGSCDTSIVESVLDELVAQYPAGDALAVVKSTVPPGSTERWAQKYEGTGLHVAFNPEFLREGSALEDMRNQDRIILGGRRPHIDRVRDIYRTAFPNVPIHKTSSDNAEFVKYVTNCFLATKISFANEMYQICEKMTVEGSDVDYDRVIELATLDKRLGTSHWKVPGPIPADDGTGKLLRGFGLSCFPKDLNSMINHARALGVDPKMLDAAWQKNLEVRPERDWEKLVGRAVNTK